MSSDKGYTYDPLKHPRTVPIPCVNCIYFEGIKDTLEENRKCKISWFLVERNRSLASLMQAYIERETGIDLTNRITLSLSLFHCTDFKESLPNNKKERQKILLKLEKLGISLTEEELYLMEKIEAEKGGILPAKISNIDVS